MLMPKGTRERTRTKAASGQFLLSAYARRQENTAPIDHHEISNKLDSEREHTSRRYELKVCHSKCCSFKKRTAK